MEVTVNPKLTSDQLGVLRAVRHLSQVPLIDVQREIRRFVPDQTDDGQASFSKLSSLGLVATDVYGVRITPQGTEVLAEYDARAGDGQP